MTSSYGWMITKDFIATDHDEINVGRTGPRDIPLEFELALAKGHGVSFKLYDDDGEKFYEGRYYSVEDAAAEDETAFGPLDDFGRPNDGAVTISYRRANGRFEIL